MNQLSRRNLIAGGSAFAGVAFVRSTARAAQFEYKFAHGTTTDYPVHVRTIQMWEAVKRETGGRLDVKTFPNNILGSELAQLTQLRSGAIQFMIIAGVSLSSIVPAAQIDGVGFAFRDSASADRAFDGPLGGWVQSEIQAKGIFAFRTPFDFGMRQIAAAPHAIRSVADFNGFKIRTPPAQITIDLFKTLGASPTPIVFPELYTSLETKIVEGLELPVATIQTSHFFEVTRYLSLTNHAPTIFWFLANMDAWKALPSDVQATVLRHAHQTALLQRQDSVQQNLAVVDKLHRLGMAVNAISAADSGSMRAQLKPFYDRWKANFGPRGWGLLEAAAGKLT